MYGFTQKRHAHSERACKGKIFSDTEHYLDLQQESVAESILRGCCIPLAVAVPACVIAVSQLSARTHGAGQQSHEAASHCRGNADVLVRGFVALNYVERNSTAGQTVEAASSEWRF